MLRDISDWERIGYGGKSTLEKEELKSPDGTKYLIKYPREFEVGVSWEDITELIAAEIGDILKLDTMDVEIVIRHGRRGCLLKNFTILNDEQIENEEGGSLLNINEEYFHLLSTKLTGRELIEYGFSFVTELPYWNQIRESFIKMQFFDILIGNQDRHPYNWLLLFFSSRDIRFSPLYDNGASLGFRFDDDKLNQMSSDTKLDKYTRNTNVKAGLFERKKVKAKILIQFLLDVYPEESSLIIKDIAQFDVERYNKYIYSLNIINETQKNWLVKMLLFRRTKILQWVGKEDYT